MHKLVLLVAVFLLTAPNVYADSCKNPGAVWAVDCDNPDKGVEYFGVGTWICISGEKLYSVAGNDTVPWTITDQDDPDPPPKPVMANDTVSVDGDGNFYNHPTGWQIPPLEVGETEHHYRLNVVSNFDEDEVCNSGIKTKKDTLYAIPEFTTVAIPAILSLGGYLAVRRKRKWS